MVQYLVKRKNMTKPTILFWVTLIILLSFSCSDENSQLNVTPPEIKIAEAFIEKRKINLSNFIEGKIEYIPLEKRNDLILASPSRIYISSNNVICFSPRQIFLYDRVTGKFIREIGKHDKGPVGYMATLFSFPFDPVRQIINARGWDRSNTKYNLNGDYLGKVVSPEGSTEIGAINDTTSVAFMRNFSGNEDRS